MKKLMLCEYFQCIHSCREKSFLYPSFSDTETTHEQSEEQSRMSSVSKIEDEGDSNMQDTHFKRRKIAVKLEEEEIHIKPGHQIKVCKKIISANMVATCDCQNHSAKTCAIFCLGLCLLYPSLPDTEITHAQSEDQTHTNQVPKIKTEGGHSMQESDVKKRKTLVKLEEGGTETKTEHEIKVCN
jgi:hypothetical protein